LFVKQSKTLPLSYFCFFKTWFRFCDQMFLKM